MPAWLALMYIHSQPLHTEQFCKECQNVSTTETETYKTVINAFLINYGHFVICNQIKNNLLMTRNPAHPGKIRITRK